VKIFVKIKNKVDKVNDKVQKIEKKMNRYKNDKDVLKNEKEYFQTKSNELQHQKELLTESTFKLEGDVEDLMKFEQDFQRMVRQNEEKDSEILKLEDEIDDYKLNVHSLQMELRG
jgi:chromosome segregation ATPase